MEFMTCTNILKKHVYFFKFMAIHVMYIVIMQIGQMSQNFLIHNFLK